MSKAAADTLDKVSAEFEAEVMAEIASGRSGDLAKVESVRKETAEAVAKILETGSKQAESLRRQIIGAAELEARNAQLRALEKAVNEAFERATQDIAASTGASYEKAIEMLIREGLEVIGTSANVRCASKDRRAVEAAVRKIGRAKVSIEDDPIETIGGVVLSTPDGSVRFDNTFEARLERMRPDLRRQVAAVLTGSA